jgi:hypothetical protein
LFAVPGKPSPEVAHYRARIGGLARRGVPTDDPRYEEARRDMHAQLIHEHVTKLLAKAPPLGPEQRTKLAELLKPVRRQAEAAVDK